MIKRTILGLIGVSFLVSTAAVGGTYNNTGYKSSGHHGNHVDRQYRVVKVYDTQHSEKQRQWNQIHQLEKQINASWRYASEAGTYHIPRDIKRLLGGFYGENLLDKVKFRVASPAEYELAAKAFRPWMENARAVALGDVILFKNKKDAMENVKLWVYEIAHIQKYLQMGVDGYAKAYVKNYKAVEGYAAQKTRKFKQWIASYKQPAPSNQHWGHTHRESYVASHGITHTY